MNRAAFLKVFLKFFAVFAVLNLYIFISGLNSIPPHLNIPYVLIFLLLFLAFPVYLIDRLFFKALPVKVNTFLHWAGSVWIGLFTYFLIAVLVIDIARLSNLLIPFFPQSFYTDYANTKFTAFLTVCAIVFAVFAYGFFNARTPRIKSLRLNVNKKAGALKSLKIAAASDIHLGVIVNTSRLKRIVKMLNSINADIILLPGDVIDEDLEPVIRQNLGEHLKQLKAKYGVYAVTGNHEYIGGVEPAVKYLTEHGITVLRDSFVKINDSFYVIGREDRSGRGFAGIVRKPLDTVMKGTVRSLPLILMDHQPADLNDAETAGIDLQLSGHTHHGQFFPFNLVTRRMFELSWGYKKRSGTHYYVSSGAGTWGPPIRIGNNPEILSLTLSFND